MSSNEITILEKKEVSPFESKVEKLVVADAKGMTEATGYLSQLNRSLDKVIAYKEKKTKPLNELLKVIRGETKPIEVRLEAMIASLRGKMSKYQTEQHAIAEEKKEKIAARVGEGKGKLKVETASAQMDEVDTPDKAISTEFGTAKFRTVKKFEIVDFSRLPNSYKLPNEPLIRQAMKEGTPLDGVRYFEVQEPVNSR